LTAVVLQARLDSSRLPGKVLLPLGGKPLISRVMEALNQITGNTEYEKTNKILKIIACTEDSYDSFKPLAKEAGFEIFAGPKDDVLDRFCQVIKKYSIERVIRATGDNPFVFADAADALNNEAVLHNADYAGFLELPYGAGVESIRACALLRAFNEALLPPEREHVCPYLYNHLEIFKLHRPFAPASWRYPQMRVTIDTQEDYENALKLYDVLKDSPFRFNGETIINAYNKVFK